MIKGEKEDTDKFEWIIGSVDGAWNLIAFEKEIQKKSYNFMIAKIFQFQEMKVNFFHFIKCRMTR